MPLIGLALDGILALVLVEGFALAIVHRRTGLGIAPGALIGNLAAGFFLVLTARLALDHQSDALLAGALFLALCAHLADLAVRWRR